MSFSPHPPPICYLADHYEPGADPGFPVGGGAGPLGGGVPTYNFVKFSEKLHEIFELGGHVVGVSPPKSATVTENKIDKHLNINQWIQNIPDGNGSPTSDFGPKTYYRLGTVNSKSFVGKDLHRIKWKFELTVHFKHKIIGK